MSISPVLAIVAIHHFLRYHTVGHPYNLRASLTRRFYFVSVEILWGVGALKQSYDVFDMTIRGRNVYLL